MFHIYSLHILTCAHKETPCSTGQLKYFRLNIKNIYRNNLNIVCECCLFFVVFFEAQTVEHDAHMIMGSILTNILMHELIQIE